MSEIKINTELTCGCCGIWFRTWNGYIDQDQDTGFGICSGCQGDAGEREKSIMDDCIAKVLAASNDKCRVRFEAMTRARQESVIYKLMDKGVLKWSIGSAL